jgi:hypothetical protein
MENNEVPRAHFGWKEWVLLMTFGINIATFLLRTDIRALVYNGWNWLYFLSFCICGIYMADLYFRVERWAEGIASATKKALGELNEAAQAHKNSMEAGSTAFETKMGYDRSEWRRAFAETVEDVVRYKAGTADLAKLEAKINQRFESIESRLPPVGAS